MSEDDNLDTYLDADGNDPDCVGVRGSFLRWLRLNGACRDAREWVHKHGFADDPRGAWAACPRADWLLWLACKGGASKRRLANALFGLVATVSGKSPLCGDVVELALERIHAAAFGGYARYAPRLYAGYDDDPDPATEYYDLYNNLLDVDYDDFHVDNVAYIPCIVGYLHGRRGTDGAAHPGLAEIVRESVAFDELGVQALQRKEVSQ